MIKQCKQCGKDFEAKPRQVFCPRCKKFRKAEQNRQYNKRRNSPKPPKPPKPEPPPKFNECCMCGKKFKPSYPREHFCSDECRYNSPLAKALLGDDIDWYR